MELPPNPHPWQENNADDHEQTVQDYTPVDAGIRVVLVNQPQAPLPRMDDDDLLVAAFCEV